MGPLIYFLTLVLLRQIFARHSYFAPDEASQVEVLIGALPLHPAIAAQSGSCHGVSVNIEAYFKAIRAYPITA